MPVRSSKYFSFSSSKECPDDNDLVPMQFFCSGENVSTSWTYSISISHYRSAKWLSVFCIILWIWLVYITFWSTLKRHRWGWVLDHDGIVKLLSNGDLFPKDHRYPNFSLNKTMISYLLSVSKALVSKPKDLPVRHRGELQMLSFGERGPKRHLSRWVNRKDWGDGPGKSNSLEYLWNLKRETLIVTRQWCKLVLFSSSTSKTLLIGILRKWNYFSSVFWGVETIGR